ncbi:MAG: SH3 domain-containing protein [Saprospiraceae bacterium]
MARKSAAPRLRIEFVLTAVVLLVFMIWASRSCNSTRAEYAMIAEEEARRAYEDSVQVAQDAALQAAELETAARAAAAARVAADAAEETVIQLGGDTLGGGGRRIIREKVVPLYTTIDGLNVRSGPGMNYKLVDRLPLFEEVHYLGEVTDSTYQINLGRVTPDEPWVKIRTPKGKPGWVYGAGVSYYKKKLEGVEN